VQITYLLVGF